LIDENLMPAYLHSTQDGGGEHCLNNEVIKEWGKDGREWNFGFCLGTDGDVPKSAPRQGKRALGLFKREELEVLEEHHGAGHYAVSNT
jgi:hypothetical protein